MSNTVTTSELQHILSDYKLHLTGSDETIKLAPLSSPARPQNPSSWPADRHRVPPYRPIDRTLDFDERPNGSNAAEHVFLVILFTGVFLNAVSGSTQRLHNTMGSGLTLAQSTAKLWGMTGGPYFPGLFKYAIGGEW